MIQPERVAVIHVGTHKTGTTSLQARLALNQELLRQRGVCYPKAGRFLYGQHNLAWELNDDVDQFAPNRGTVIDLLAEIERERSAAVVLSSEDFEYLYRLPERLSYLRDALRSVGYTSRVVISFREPVSYIESLYAELRKHGMSRSLREVVAEVIECGGLSVGCWDFRLDYQQLLDGFVGVFGKEHVTVVRYDASEVVNAVLRAFEAKIDISLAGLRDVGRLNPRQGSSVRQRVVQMCIASAHRSKVWESTAPISRNRLKSEERVALSRRFDATYQRIVGDGW